jgi:hypothetical protein
MPVSPTYPGVYLTEVTSPVHTITGVPTSIAAFVGPAAQGPVDVATEVNSWAEFERTFGGLLPGREMSYAVYQFFLNGGATAQIVRVTGTPVKGSDGKAPAPAGAAAYQLVQDTSTTPPTTLSLVANSPGTWADNYIVRIEATKALGPTDPSTGQQPSDDTGLPTYNLSVIDPATKVILERYVGISAAGGSQGLLAQLRASTIFTVDGDPALKPVAKDYPRTTKGDDGPDVILNDLNFTLSESQQAVLDKVDIFNMLCIPDAARLTAWTGSGTGSDDALYTSFVSAITTYCHDRRAMFLVDPPQAWPNSGQPIESQLVVHDTAIGGNAAFYYPRVSVVDQAGNGLRTLGPSGTLAGVYAATDTARGVWKAPAGTAASLTGVVDLDVKLTDKRNGDLNQLGVNCLRNFPIYGPVSWGARTANGADQDADQWKYVPVRRTALFIEESLFRGTKWVVFEPNDEPLWASIRLNVGSFMNGLFRQGAFQGSTPQEAYLVKCDAENNPQSQIDLGIVNILVGFAPLKPAEFVIINIQQLTGDLAG